MAPRWRFPCRRRDTQIIGVAHGPKAESLFDDQVKSEVDLDLDSSLDSQGDDLRVLLLLTMHVSPRSPPVPSASSSVTFRRDTKYSKQVQLLFSVSHFESYKQSPT